MPNLTEILKQNMIEINKARKSKASAQKFVEDDSCDSLIRIRFVHEFSSLIIKFFGFEKLNVFIKLFVRIIPILPTIHYTESTLDLLVALRTLKGKFSIFFRGEIFHSGLVGSCTSVLLGPRTTCLHHWLINNILHSSVSARPSWARGPIRANRSNRLIAGPAPMLSIGIKYLMLRSMYVP